MNLKKSKIRAALVFGLFLCIGAYSMTGKKQVKTVDHLVSPIPQKPQVHQEPEFNPKIKSTEAKDSRPQSGTLPRPFPERQRRPSSAQVPEKIPGVKKTATCEEDQTASFIKRAQDMLPQSDITVKSPQEIWMTMDSQRCLDHDPKALYEMVAEFYREETGSQVPVKIVAWKENRPVFVGTFFGPQVF